MFTHLGVSSNGFNRFGEPCLKLRVPGTAHKRCCIPTTCEPALLLPTGESGGAIRHLLNNGIRNPLIEIVATYAGRIRKLRVELLMRRTIGDTPWANAIGKLLH